ncbi:MAG: DUF1653 domain-containing protein [Acetivibrio ethanolgignens]
MEERKNPVPGELYCHFKGKLYEIITIAIHSETEEEMVVYRQKYGEFKTYVRPLTMFMSEVDHEKYPEVKQKYRFERIVGNERPLEQAEVVDSGLEEASGGLLYDFLDAPTLKEKLKVLEDRKRTPDDLTITNMAISVDVVVEEGTPEERLEELIDCLKTMARFECTRLR